MKPTIIKNIIKDVPKETSDIKSKNPCSELDILYQQYKVAICDEHDY
jgi:hypothetical protein